MEYPGMNLTRPLSHLHNRESGAMRNGGRKGQPRKGDWRWNALIVMCSKGFAVVGAHQWRCSLHGQGSWQAASMLGLSKGGLVRGGLGAFLDTCISLCQHGWQDVRQKSESLDSSDR